MIELLLRFCARFDKKTIKRFLWKHFHLDTKRYVFHQNVFFSYGSLEGNGAVIVGVINEETDGAKQPPTSTLLDMKHSRKASLQPFGFTR